MARWTSPMLTEMRHISIQRPAISSHFEPMNLAIMENLTLPLFKLTEREHLDSFMADGTIRIGTVMEFARREQQSRGMGDFNEGSRWMLYNGEHACIPVSIQITIVNSYVFCSTKNVSTRLIEEWKPSACYAILDAKFFEEIGKQLSLVADFGLVHDVYYGNWECDQRINQWIDEAWIGPSLSDRTPFPHLDSIPRITWLKDVDLSYQDEVRAIYEPFTLPGVANQDLAEDWDASLYDEMRANRVQYLDKRGVFPRLQPIILKVPDARQYVSDVPLNSLVH